MILTQSGQQYELLLGIVAAGLPHYKNSTNLPSLLSVVLRKKEGFTLNVEIQPGFFIQIFELMFCCIDLLLIWNLFVLFSRWHI